MKLFLCMCILTFNVFASGILGEKAPSFGVDTWLQNNNKPTLDIKDFKGKVLYVYGFQAWCPGCHSHGFPTLQKLSKHYAGDKDVAFVAIQTVFEGYSSNTIQAAAEIIKRYKLTIPVGHSGINGKRSEFMSRYKSGGTPWTVIIDKTGVVRFNDFHAKVENIIQYMDMLKKEL